MNLCLEIGYVCIVFLQQRVGCLFFIKRQVPLVENVVLYTVHYSNVLKDKLQDSPVSQNTNKDCHLASDGSEFPRP